MYWCNKFIQQFALILPLRVCIVRAIVGHVGMLQLSRMTFRKQKIIIYCKQYCSTTTSERRLQAIAQTRRNTEQQLNCLLTCVHITFTPTFTNSVQLMNYFHNYSCVSCNKANICEARAANLGKIINEPSQCLYNLFLR